jgi:hypothetical protein
LGNHKEDGALEATIDAKSSILGTMRTLNPLEIEIAPQKVVYQFRIAQNQVEFKKASTQSRRLHVCNVGRPSVLMDPQLIHTKIEWSSA